MSPGSHHGSRFAFKEERAAKWHLEKFFGCEIEILWRIILCPKSRDFNSNFLIYGFYEIDAIKIFNVEWLAEVCVSDFHNTSTCFFCVYHTQKKQRAFCYIKPDQVEIKELQSMCVKLFRHLRIARIINCIFQKERAARFRLRDIF